MEHNIKLPEKLPELNIKVPPVNVAVKIYDAEKNTLLGIPVPALITGAVIVVSAIFIIKRRGKKK
jgi:hypothetical protein